MRNRAVNGVLKTFCGGGVRVLGVFVITKAAPQVRSSCNKGRLMLDQQDASEKAYSLIHSSTQRIKTIIVDWGPFAV